MINYILCASSNVSAICIKSSVGSGNVSYFNYSIIFSECPSKTFGAINFYVNVLIFYKFLSIIETDGYETTYDYCYDFRDLLFSDFSDFNSLFDIIIYFYYGK